jgi:hypothetical protein
MEKDFRTAEQIGADLPRAQSQAHELRLHWKLRQDPRIDSDIALTPCRTTSASERVGPVRSRTAPAPGRGIL